ncbi:WD40-repeat-containing domain protein [Massariosphaeria phaeospora]|uniref:WD40-repeat-containing domain protein n=1 Tax=Massariosphaeria phaeospora TaxID=100035 RepID=A0A7C8IGD6_9PLEO|nr:WD40-repeat-containing domain protein [Massariosphaeria phaeospora]
MRDDEDFFTMTGLTAAEAYVRRSVTHSTHSTQPPTSTSTHRHLASTMLPSPAELVARFLRANGYTETLARFIQEAGLSNDAGSSSGAAVTLEKILEEKKTFDVSLNFEKLGLHDESEGWTTPAPTKPMVLSTLPTRSNLLAVTALRLILPTKTEPQQYIATTTADRRLNLIDPADPSLPLVHSFTAFQDSPILDVMVLKGKYLLTASMSGKLLLYDTVAERILDERKDHSKFLVKLASWSDGTSAIVASAGWDAKVHLYRVRLDQDRIHQLGEPIATLSLSSIPEAILFTQSPDTSSPVLVLTRRDSSFLYYYAVPVSDDDPRELILLGRQNLAPHSTAWVAFTPSDVQLCPVDPSLAAIATSSTPHMKLIIVRLLVPPSGGSAADTLMRNLPQASGIIGEHVTQASQARAQLLLQDREEAAISINVSTMAPQTAYSTPKLAWRPTGSGVYVSSDDGIVRGFEAASGKLVATLEAHQAGSKLRCLWAGRLTGHPEDECLLSGGFDQRLILWRTA